MRYEKLCFVASRIACRRLNRVRSSVSPQQTVHRPTSSRPWPERRHRAHPCLSNRQGTGMALSWSAAVRVHSTSVASRLRCGSRRLGLVSSSFSPNRLRFASHHCDHYGSSRSPPRSAPPAIASPPAEPRFSRCVKAADSCLRFWVVRLEPRCALFPNYRPQFVADISQTVRLRRCRSSMVTDVYRRKPGRVKVGSRLFSLSTTGAQFPLKKGFLTFFWSKFTMP